MHSWRGKVNLVGGETVWVSGGNTLMGTREWKKNMPQAGEQRGSLSHMDPGVGHMLAGHGLVGDQLSSCEWECFCYMCRRCTWTDGGWWAEGRRGGRHRTSELRGVDQGRGTPPHSWTSALYILSGSSTGSCRIRILQGMGEFRGMSDVGMQLTCFFLGS